MVRVSGGLVGGFAGATLVAAVVLAFGQPLPATALLAASGDVPGARLTGVFAHVLIGTLAGGGYATALGSLLGSQRRISPDPWPAIAAGIALALALVVPAFAAVSAVQGLVLAVLHLPYGTVLGLTVAFWNG